AGLTVSRADGAKMQQTLLVLLGCVAAASSGFGGGHGAGGKEEVAALSKDPVSGWRVRGKEA
ncbi:MAG: hypothetical protein ACK5RW_02665, partial [bacterium]